MKTTRFTVSLVLFCTLVSSYACSQRKYDIVYLGNMGVAITHNDSAIIIDGLHDFYRAEYLPTDTSLLQRILNKETPFRTILALCFTHFHNDHFDSTLVSQVVSVHKQVKLIGTSQTKNLLNTAGQQMYAPVSDSIKLTVGKNITMQVRKIPHINPRHVSVENYRFEIEWNGYRFIHLGDAAIVPESVAYITKAPDVMIVPGWFMVDAGKKFLVALNPKKTIVTHIEPFARHNQYLSHDYVRFENYGAKYSVQ